MGKFFRALHMLIFFVALCYTQEFNAPELPTLGNHLVIAANQPEETSEGRMARSLRTGGLTVVEQQQIIASLVDRISDLIVTSFKFLNDVRKHLSVELPRGFSEEKLKMIGDFMAGMFVLADELEGMRQSIAQVIAKMRCMGDKSVFIAGKQISCSEFNCSTKLQCLQSVMKDLFGYFEFIGKKREKYENRGILDPLFDIMFTGYTIKNQKRRALVPLWFEILGIPQKHMYDIILAVQEMRQILRLVATLTLETESDESGESKDKPIKSLFDTKTKGGKS